MLGDRQPLAWGPVSAGVLRWKPVPVISCGALMWRRPAPGSSTMASPTSPVGRTILVKICLKMNGEERAGAAYPPIWALHPGGRRHWGVSLACVLLSGCHDHTNLHSTVFPLGRALHLVASISELVQDPSLGCSVRAPVGLLLMEVSYWVLRHSFYWPPKHLCKRPAQLKWWLKMQSGVLLFECRRKNSRGKRLNKKEPCPSQGWN